MSSIADASRYMSSRSSGVTNVRFRRLITSRVSRSPSVSSSRMSRSRSRLAGQSASRSTSACPISRAFADASVKRSKNSRFCGVRRSGMPRCIPVHQIETRRWLGSAAVAADEQRTLTSGSRVLVYASAGALFAIALVVAALRVGEQAGRLSDWQALALGVTQGFSELLPISSSGHLILVPWLANWTYLEHHESFNKTFDVSLHLGTLVAVVAYFWGDVVRYVAAFIVVVRNRVIRTDDERLSVGIAIATVPAAIVGALG